MPRLVFGFPYGHPELDPKQGDLFAPPPSKKQRETLEYLKDLQRRFPKGPAGAHEPSPDYINDRLAEAAAEDDDKGGSGGFGARLHISAHMPKTLVFDFDGTINMADYPRLGEPNSDIVERMRRAKDAGIEVVIQSCRWSEHDLNTPKQARRQMHMAEWWLRKHDIPYDRLAAGKPLGELYVDDKACPVTDLQMLDQKIEELASPHPVEGGLKAALRRGDIVTTWHDDRTYRIMGPCKGILDKKWDHDTYYVIEVQPKPGGGWEDTDHRDTLSMSRDIAEWTRVKASRRVRAEFNEIDDLVDRAEYKFWITPKKKVVEVESGMDHIDTLRDELLPKEHDALAKRHEDDEGEVCRLLEEKAYLRGYVRGWFHPGEALGISPGKAKDDRMESLISVVLRHNPEWGFVTQVFSDVSEVPVLEGEDALSAWRHRNDIRHREAVRASMIDYPHERLAADIWTPDGHLRAEVRTQMEADVYAMLGQVAKRPKEWVVRLLLGSSIATQFYTAETDIDIKVEVDWEKLSLANGGMDVEELDAAVADMDREFSLGAHPYEVRVYADGSFDTPEKIRNYDALYDITNGVWVKRPKTVAPGEYSREATVAPGETKAVQVAEKWDLTLGSLRRGLNELRTLANYLFTDGAETKSDLRRHRAALLAAVTRVIEALHAQKTAVKEARGAAYRQSALETVNAEPDVIQMKLLVSWGYFAVIKALHDYLEDHTPLTFRDVEPLLGILEGGSEVQAGRKPKVSAKTLLDTHYSAIRDIGYQFFPAPRTSRNDICSKVNGAVAAALAKVGAKDFTLWNGAVMLDDDAFDPEYDEKRTTDRLYHTWIEADGETYDFADDVFFTKTDEPVGIRDYYEDGERYELSLSYGDPALEAEVLNLFKGVRAALTFAGTTPGVLDIHVAGRRQQRIPEAIWSVLHNMEANGDVGAQAEQVGKFFIAAEGFGDECWVDHDPGTDLRALATEVIDSLAADYGVVGRPLKSGWLHPPVHGEANIVYAIWWTPDSTLEGRKAVPKLVFASPSRRVVTATWEDPVWQLVWENGFTEYFPTPEAVLKAVKKSDAKAVRSGAAVAITTIEWHNAPQGFRVPAAKIDELLKLAKAAVEDDPRWEGYTRDPAKANELGLVQRAVAEARSRDELAQIWEQFGLEPSLDALDAQAETRAREEKAEKPKAAAKAGEEKPDNAVPKKSK